MLHVYSDQSGEVNDHYCCHHDACSDQRGETDDHFCRHEPWITHAVIRVVFNVNTYPCPPLDRNISWLGNCRWRSLVMSSMFFGSPACRRYSLGQTFIFKWTGMDAIPSTVINCDANTMCISKPNHRQPTQDWTCIITNSKPSVLDSVGLFEGTRRETEAALASWKNSLSSVMFCWNLLDANSCLSWTRREIGAALAPWKTQ